MSRFPRPSSLLGRRATRGFPWSAPSWPSGVERRAPRRRLGVDYDTSWSRSYGARLARALWVDNVTRPFIHALCSPEVRGAEILELVEPPAIFVANHASHVDTPLLVSLLPLPFRHRTVVAAAADTFFDRRWKGHLWALSLAAVPIDRHKVSRRSADLAAKLVEESWNLVIFPEGGRSTDGWGQPFRGGAAYLAVRTGRPVVPVHLRGTWRIWPKGGGRLRRGPTRVTFGTPIYAAAGEDARRLNHRIEQAVSVLADEDDSNWWQARKRAAAGKTPDPGGPDASVWRRSWALRPGPSRAVEEKDLPGRWAVEKPFGPPDHARQVAKR